MQAETAKALLETIADGFQVALDVNNRLIALERLLANHRRDLFQEYEQILAEVRRRPPTELSVAGFARLQEMLSRD